MRHDDEALLKIWAGVNSPENDFCLDNEGFVYTSAFDGLPYWICDWGDDAWQFYWHIGQFWMVHRAVTIAEAQRLYIEEDRLTPAQAQAYHNVNDRNRPR